MSFEKSVPAALNLEDLPQYLFHLLGLSLQVELYTNMYLAHILHFHERTVFDYIRDPFIFSWRLEAKSIL